MSASKITNYFQKMPPSGQRTVERTVANAEPQVATSNSSKNNDKTNGRVSVEDTSFRKADTSRSNDNLGKRPVIIDLDSQQDSDDEVDTSTMTDDRLKSRKVYQIYKSSDSEADIEDLSLQSPLKTKRKFIIDHDDSEDNASDSLSQSTNRKNNRGHSDTDNLSHKNQSQDSLQKERSARLSSSRKLGQSDTSSDEDLNLSCGSQGSLVEVLLSEQQENTRDLKSGDSDADSEDWDVDKAARKGKGRQITNEGTPGGPMDRFTQRRSGYGTHENSNWVQEESDDESDDQDDFVVDDDVIDGEKTNEAAAPVELPAEFSTRYQDDTEGHFRTYFEYLMRRIHNPSYRNFHNLDTRFQVAISSVQRLMETCKDKIYTSVWKPEFVEDLSYWPSMSFKALRELDHDCDACQISGKGSTCSITFYGSGYDENYMPVNFNSFLPDNSLSEQMSQKSPQIQQGERARSGANIKENEVENEMWLSYADDRPNKAQYWVGSTCFYRARVFHGLVHLQHDLSVEIRAFVDSIFDTVSQEDNAIAIFEQNVDFIIRRMNDTGFSDKLWSMARQRVNDALHFRTDRMPIDESAFLWA
ncbi:hypothetical protein NQZ79_g999 [Umbelopsis isabellina]|nr:hypothetical protein NQZ79_g999 [Umbelopsis isabellina]